MTRTRRATSAAVGGMITWIACSAFAQQPAPQPPIARQPPVAMPRAMRIEYTAPEHCPDVTFFRDRVVLKRAVHADPFTDSAPARLVVTLAMGAGGYRGTWEAFDAGGASVRRHDLGPVANCHDLADGLAFGFVLRFDDPNAPPLPPSAPSPVVPAPVVVPPPPVRTPEPPGHVFVGAGGVVGLAVTPAPAGGGSFAFGWRAPWWSLSAELRAMVTLNAPVDGGYSVTLHRVTGVLLPCMHWRVLFGCAALELGELGGISNASVPESDSAFIATAGGRIGVEAPISKHLAFRGTLDGFATVKPSIIRIADLPRWQTPAGGASIGAGLAWFF
ncbi:MAG: hypothetical protein U0441_07105 [Polyangiaceae bacterium]